MKNYYRFKHIIYLDLSDTDNKLVMVSMEE